MDKQEYNQQVQKLKEEQNRFYEAEPKVSSWIRIKKIIFRCMAVYWIVHAILTIIVIVQIQSDISIGMEIFKAVMQIFWMYVFLSPQGSWRLNLIFYFWALANFGLNLMNYMGQMRGYILSMFTQFPVMGIMFIMEMLVPFILLGVACFLTLPAEHRRLSEKAEEMRKEFLEKAKAIGSQ